MFTQLSSMDIGGQLILAIDVDDETDNQDDEVHGESLLYRQIKLMK